MSHRVVALLLVLTVVAGCEKGPEAPPTQEPDAAQPDDDEPEPEFDDDPPNLS